MRILPVTNYQTQNRQNTNINVNFGLFRIAGNNREETLNGLITLCSKYAPNIKIGKYPKKWWFFLSSDAEKAFKRGKWNEEVIIEIKPHDVEHLDLLLANIPPKLHSKILKKYLTPGIFDPSKPLY